MKFAINLTEKEEAMYKKLAEFFGTLKSNCGLGEKLPDEEIQDIYEKAAFESYQFHQSLATRGIEVKWSKGIQKNRIKEDKLDPSKFEFHRKYHVIEDLLHFIEHGTAYRAPKGKVKQK